MACDEAVAVLDATYEEEIQKLRAVLAAANENAAGTPETNAKMVSLNEENAVLCARVAELSSENELFVSECYMYMGRVEPIQHYLKAVLRPMFLDGTISEKDGGPRVFSLPVALFAALANRGSSPKARRPLFCSLNA
jgi:hypothetical protein